MWPGITLRKRYVKLVIALRLGQNVRNVSDIMDLLLRERTSRESGIGSMLPLTDSVSWQA